MKIHLISGFLGSGKTTAIQQAAYALLQKNVSTGVITNDQGSKLVDGGLFQHLGIPSREVINGCFCCNYKALDASIASLIASNKTEVIFAESVGSCTDIVATVLKPLLQFKQGVQVTVSVLADVRLLQMMLPGTGPFDATVHYIYLKQLEEAAIIVVNKIDLIDTEALQVIKITMQAQYGHKIIVYQDSLNADSIQQWINTLDNYTVAATLSSLQIDYDLYAAGEAKLGWLDQVMEVYSEDNNNALQEAEHLINRVYTKINEAQYPIGHIKFLVNQAIKISFTDASAMPAVLPHTAARSAQVLMNMRVQADPETLTRLVAAAIAEMINCRIIVQSQSAFQPGYPTPLHRM